MLNGWSVVDLALLMALPTAVRPPRVGPKPDMNSLGWHIHRRPGHGQGYQIVVLVLEGTIDAGWFLFLVRPMVRMHVQDGHVAQFQHAAVLGKTQHNIVQGWGMAKDHHGTNRGGVLRPESIAFRRSLFQSHHIDNAIRIVVVIGIVAVVFVLVVQRDGSVRCVILVVLSVFVTPYPLARCESDCLASCTLAHHAQQRTKKPPDHTKPTTTHQGPSVERSHEQGSSTKVLRQPLHVTC